MDFNEAKQMIQQNNAWSAQQAQKQMDFQERMSNTAHQREIADLQAAGLNPVLSAKLGGASTPSGAMGDTDTSGTSTLIQLAMQSLQTSGYAAKAASDTADSLMEITQKDNGDVKMSPSKGLTKMANKLVSALPLPSAVKKVISAGLETELTYTDKKSYSKIFNWLNNMTALDPFGLGYVLMPKANRDGTEQPWAFRWK